MVTPITKLSAQEVLNSVFDEATNSLYTTGATSAGGTQYAEGATAATATGTLAMWKSGTSVLAASTANPFPVNIVSGSSSGTQYTEDAASASDPIGTAVNLIRKDTPAAITSADGDNIAQRGTNYGAGYVQVVTSAGAFVDTFGGGTQFADGAARSTATGTLSMVDDGTLIQSMKGDSSGRPCVTVDTALPAGTALIGKVGIDQTTPGTTNKVSIGSDGTVAISGTVPVTGTFYQATQPVSIAGTVAISGALTDTQLRASAVPISVASLPLPSGAATEASVAIIAGAVTSSVVQDNIKQINGVAPSMGNGASGTGVQRVTLASDSTGQVALAAGVAEIGNVKNSGTFATQAAQSGTWTVQPGNTANTTAWKVDNSAVNQPIIPTSLEVTGSVSSATNVIAATDVKSYRWASVQIAGTFVGTITFECSNDGITYFAVPLLDSRTTSGSASTTTTTTGVYSGALAGRYFQARVSSYTSGTVTSTAEFSSLTTVFPTMSIDTELSAAATLADATTNPSTTALASYKFNFNGTTWDRARSGSITATSTRTGLDNNIPFGYYVTTPSTRTTGQVAPLQQSSTGQLHTTAFPTPDTTLQTTAYFNSALTATAVAVKTTAGNIYWYEFINTGASAAFVQVFNLAVASVTLGTTTPTHSFYVPAAGANDKVSTMVLIAGTTALTIAATTTATGSSAPATALVANIGYK